MDRTITPSYVTDVARATRQLIEMQAPAGLYHCVNSGVTTWMEFAAEMARLIGVEPRLTPVRLAEMNLNANRPVYCALSNDKLRSLGIDMPSWQDALARNLSGSGPPADAFGGAHQPDEFRAMPVGILALEPLGQRERLRKDETPLNSLSRSSMPNSATAAAKPSSADVVAAARRRRRSSACCRRRRAAL